ncbi:hypothetical protein QYM36_017171 [Artemia franciscana]|nr:hypothetical protein QYM36_017171 [Artemia franciscana]
MTIEKPEVYKTDATPMAVSEWENHDRQTDQFVIYLEEDLQVGEIYTVSIKFIGNLNNLAAGFYRSSYVNSEGVTKWHAVTQFESTDARRAFPSFDEPNMKALFKVTLGRTPDYSTLSNTRQTETGVPHEFDPSFVWDIYEVSPVLMPTYLVAFAVFDFVRFEGSPSSGGTPIAHYANPNYNAEQASLGLTVTPVMIDFYESYTGFMYSLDKMDQVAVPYFAAGAMENWGLVKYRESLLLWDGPLKVAARAEQNVVGVIAHELSHQWFGNLVTCDWWSVIWLNEGITTYMENLALGAARSDWPQEQMFVVDTKQYVMGGPDSLDTSRPMYVPVDSNNEADGVFDSIAYEKSGSVVRMVEGFLGNDTFVRGMRKYLDENQFDNSEMIDLFQAWQSVADEDQLDFGGATVQEIMDTWTLQMNFPLVTVTRDYTTRSAELRQERYVRPPYNGEPEPYFWWIPVTYTQDFSTESIYWFENIPGPVTAINALFPEMPLIMNLRAKGYYRVNYDSVNWALIQEYIAANPISVDIMTRSQLIDDAMNLAKDGHLTYDSALGMTKFLENELEWMPWETFDNNLPFLDNLLGSRLAYGDFKLYILRLVTNLYNDVKFQDSESDGLITLYRRIVAVRWACKFALPDCKENVDSLYSRWMTSGGVESSFISPNQKSAVFCNGIRHGGLNEFNFALERYVTDVDSPDRSTIFSALACVRDPVLIDRLLEWSITNSTIIPIGSAPTLYREMATNGVARNQAFIYLRNNWDAAVEHFGTSATVANGIRSVSQYFTKDTELSELKMLRDVHANDPTAVLYLNSAVEIVERNFEWANRNYQTISVWLNNEVIGGSNSR